MNESNQSLSPEVLDLKQPYHRMFGLDILKPVLSGRYLPFTNSSLRPINVATILNDLVINGRSQIIEFGSGTSTILIARLIKLNNIKSKLITVDDDKEWLKIIKEIIVGEDLSEYINFIHAPLTKSNELTPWYDKDILCEALKSLKFQMVIIDGPQAWQKHLEMARLPALNFIADYLDHDFSIFLDDADRNGENEVLRIWENKHGFKFTKITHSLAFYKSIKGYDPTIL